MQQLYKWEYESVSTPVHNAKHKAVPCRTGKNALRFDNDPKHTSRLVQEWSQDNDVTQWPAESPDLNPIDNLKSLNLGLSRQNAQTSSL